MNRKLINCLEDKILIQTIHAMKSEADLIYSKKQKFIGFYSIDAISLLNTMLLFVHKFFCNSFFYRILL